ncbi:hypothetical protein M5K25_024117 [Dendrobium thyrsiflorum]|uniref:Glutaredoxin domain-containing protein n=1 Tax=Dendrobium thyrsiflorum TaxID=117978 RepID=A0ABD0U113_DENTH
MVRGGMVTYHYGRLLGQEAWTTGGGGRLNYGNQVMRGGWKKCGIPTLDIRGKHEVITTTATLEEEEAIGAVMILCFDILSDDDVREGMKFSNWRTFPQLYCKSELVGGCDIAVARQVSGELKDVFRDHGILLISKENLPYSGAQGSGNVVIAGSTTFSTTLASRLGTLINSSLVVLFMKGKPKEPKCGFSSKVVEFLKQEKIKFQSFNVLSDEEVRQGLKTFSNWSSFPQL